jgi:hypothetical protein
MPNEMGRSLVRIMSMPKATEMLMLLQHENQSTQMTALPNSKSPREDKVRPERFELPASRSGVRHAAVAPQPLMTAPPQDAAAQNE